MKTKIFILSVFLLAVLAGCTSDGMPDKNSIAGASVSLQNTGTTLPLDQFISWTADKENNLAKSKSVSEVTYRISYLPKEYMAYTELKNSKYTKEQFKATSKYYEGMSYFNLRIEVPEGLGELLKYDIASPQQYNERINYMSFKMQKDLFLVQGKDTLYPGLYHFERIYEVAPFATVMLAFDNSKFRQDEEFTLVFNDGIFHKGYIKYNYQPKQLIDLPNISGV